MGGGGGGSVYFGNTLFNYLRNFFVCYGSKPGSHFARLMLRPSLGGAGGESVNSTGCPEFE